MNKSMILREGLITLQHMRVNFEIPSTLNSQEERLSGLKGYKTQITRAQPEEANDRSVKHIDHPETNSAAEGRI